MEPRNDYQPDGNLTGVNLLIALALVALLILVLIGAILARAVLLQASVLFFYIALGLLPFFAFVFFGYLLWHKWRLDGVARRQADLAAQAQADELRRANERHTLEIYLAESRLLADSNGNRPFVFDRRSQQQLPATSTQPPAL